MALSIFVPIGYITVLVVSLSIFSKVYRKRTAQALAREHGQSWFVEGHPERDIYQTLVQSAADAQQKQQQGGAGAAVTIPDVVLKAALLNRAMADVRRIIRMRDDKQALAVLLQKGSIGDDMMAKIVLAEKELEAEILDVVSEANTFREGWGQLIFPSASEMVAHLKHKEAYHFVPQQRADEIKKLTEAGKTVPTPTVDLPPLVTPAGTSITIGGPAPGPQPTAAGPAPPPATVPISNGAITALKSGSVEDAGTDELQRHFYENVGSIDWEIKGKESGNGVRMLGSASPKAGAFHLGARQRRGDSKHVVAHFADHGSTSAGKGDGEDPSCEGGGGGGSPINVDSGKIGRSESDGTS